MNNKPPRPVSPAPSSSVAASSRTASSATASSNGARRRSRSATPTAAAGAQAKPKARPEPKRAGRSQESKPEVRKGRPVDADSAATRKAIIEAATAAFAQDGYHGTVLASIAQAAGITAPTLYHYFSSKAELFQIVGDEFTAEFWQRSEAAMVDIDSPTLRIAAMLRALGDWIVERPETAAFVATYASEVARNADVWRLSPAERWTEPMARFSEMAAEGIERGEIAADLDEATVAGLIQGLIYGMSALVGVGRTFGPPDQVIEAFARMIEGTVFLEATPSSARQRPNAKK